MGQLTRAKQALGDLLADTDRRCQYIYMYSNMYTVDTDQQRGSQVLFGMPYTCNMTIIVARTSWKTTYLLALLHHTGTITLKLPTRQS